MEQKALIIGEETVRKYLCVEDVIDICEKLGVEVRVVLLL